jgi:predicted amidohydrolase
MVCIASIRPTERFAGPTSSISEHLESVLGILDEAGRQGADLVCLPEDFLFQETEAESLKGPICMALAEKARQYRMNVAAGICLRVRSKKYNSVVIFDRQGRHVGRYDKTHLTKKDLEILGLTPGRDLPVFHLDIGPVGVMTCADILFGEVARCLALRGARLILFPHQQAEPSEEFERQMVQARARDNCVFIVCSTFAKRPDRPYFPNWIVGPDGRMIAEGPEGKGMTMADIDLEEKVMLADYIEPGPVDLADIVRRYRRPELYGQIIQRRKK